MRRSLVPALSGVNVYSIDKIPTYVVSAFRRTHHGPAEAGHYVRAGYSYRSASTGLTRVARRAGRYPATRDEEEQARGGGDGQRIAGVTPYS